jgi:predicted Zn finger-like uncharacterized protein
MLIVCPKCTSSYRVDSSAIGARGRSVRCVPCQNVWFVPPPETTGSAGAHPAAGQTLAGRHFPATAESLSDAAVAAFRAALADDPPASAGGAGAMPPSNGGAQRRAPDAATETEAAADLGRAEASPQTHPAVLPADAAAGDGGSLTPALPVSQPASPQPDASTIDSEPHDVESLAARRQARLAARKRDYRLRVSLPAAIAVLLIVCAVLLASRKDIVRHAPQMASFYAALGLPVNLRGLAFTDVRIANETHDGVPLLIVEGVIVSTVSRPVEVPRLRFAIRNAGGQEVYAWTAMPAQSVLEPGERLPFRSRLASPPSDGRDVQVRFFNRRDAIAGLH